MKRAILYILSAVVTLAMVVACGAKSAADLSVNDELIMWYDTPAMIWEEYLPLGNGRLGVMPSGGVAVDHLVLNEGSMWSGGVQYVDNSEAAEWLPRIRELLIRGENRRAEELMYRYFTCSGGGSSSPEYGSYQTLADMWIECDVVADSVECYRRELRLRDAVATTRFKACGVEYCRDYFTSMSDNVAVVRLCASKPADYALSVTRPTRIGVSVDGCDVRIEGELPSGSEKEGVRYYGRAHIVTDGTVTSAETKLKVEDATYVTLLFTAATTYAVDDPQATVDGIIDRNAARSYEELLGDHVAAHRALFDRVEIDFGEQRLDIPTDRRLEEYATSGDDASLAALYAQYGRYLLIGSAHNATLPPNLQGIWANTVWCPWSGDMHLNINQQMNHWALEVGNLPELIEPLTRYVEGLVQSGEHTAEHFYRAEGWCSHILANAWGFTAPSEDPSWGATNTCGGWIALHLWEHYCYTLDRAYLERVYPTMRGAALFLRSILIEDSVSGYLVTAPTTSPENGFYLNDEDAARGAVTHVCMGSTMDNQIVRELFTAIISAAEILDCDAELVQDLRYALLRLVPTRIGTDGRIMEWLEEYREAEPQHRHVSHLFGLYPAAQIDHSTPELMEAARRTLDVRGDGGTGWSRAWKICFWARLGDGDRAAKLLRSLLEPAVVESGHRGGTFPNMFCSHPPFQIDGNFGGSAGIMEMLLQSHGEQIAVLPALPTLWDSGSYRGLCARGGVVVDCCWEQGRVTSVTLTSNSNSTHTLRLPDGTCRSVECVANTPVTLQF